jgi:hypothetical protein
MISTLFILVLYNNVDNLRSTYRTALLAVMTISVRKHMLLLSDIV